MLFLVTLIDISKSIQHWLGGRGGGGERDFYRGGGNTGENRWNFSRFLQLLVGDMLRGHVVETCCSDSFPRVTSPFLRKSSVAGTELWLMGIGSILSPLYDARILTSWISINKILSPQQTFFAKTRMSQEENWHCNMSPLRVPATCSLVCAGLNGQYGIRN